jgi:hypothetical protein
MNEKQLFSFHPSAFIPHPLRTARIPAGWRRLSRVRVVFAPTKTHILAPSGLGEDSYPTSSLLLARGGASRLD